MKPNLYKPTYFKKIMKTKWVVVVLLLLVPQAVCERVERVIDGDTLLLDNGETVRLIGIDTPEYYKVTDTEKFGLDEDYLYEWGVKAKLYMEDRVLYKDVSLEYDWERRDKYERLLAYIYVNQEMINRTMIEKGYARAMPEFDFKYREEFIELEREAKKEGRGMWPESERNLVPYVAIFAAVIMGLLGLIMIRKLK